MKLTDKDVQMFKTLNQSDLGTALVDYLNRLTTDMCDVRTMKDEDVVSVRVAARYIDENIINKIKIVTQSKGLDKRDLLE